MHTSASLTEQLRRYSGGDRDIANAVFREVLPKLREVAFAILRNERYRAPYCPSELITEAWLKSLRHGGWQIRDREHFYAIAGWVMREVLVDAARSRLARRREGKPRRRWMICPRTCIRPFATMNRWWKSGCC